MVEVAGRTFSRVHHVAIIVRDIEASLAFYRDTLGLPVGLVLPIESDEVIIAFLDIGESKIELVQPTSSSTGVARFLEKKGEGFHHVCFETPDVDAALTELAGEGVRGAGWAGLDAPRLRGRSARSVADRTHAGRPRRHRHPVRLVVRLGRTILA